MGGAGGGMSDTAIIGGALALGGYAAACRLTGENLLATWWDEWRLARVSAERLAAEAAANPRDSGLVVTLTTIPSRIGAIGPTVKSLLRQTARAREIRLCVPAWSEREQCAYEVPAWLRALPGVTIAACADEGPATKFLPTLRAVAPDQAVVVVDDDRIYHPRLLETFAALAAAHPDEAVSAAGWDAPADRIDRPTTWRARLAGAPYVPVRANQVRRARRVDIVQGLHGYVVRPRFFELAALGDFTGAPAAVRFVDDVWISAHCRVPRWVRPMRLAFTDYKPWQHRRRYDRTSLGRNFNRADDHAQRGNSVALRFFSERWGR
jgi:hypothetical protein